MRIPRLLIIGTAGVTGGQTATADFISSGSAVYEPTVSSQFTASIDFIPGTNVNASRDPELDTAGEWTVSNATLAATGTLALTSATSVAKLYNSTVIPEDNYDITITVDSLDGTGWALHSVNTTLAIIIGASKIGDITSTGTYEFKNVLLNNSYLTLAQYNGTATAITVSDYSWEKVGTYEPTATPGSVTRSVDFIASGSAIYEPTATVGGGLQTVTADYIGTGSAVYEPTASPGAVTKTADYIATGSATYEPAAYICTGGNILSYSEAFDDDYYAGGTGPPALTAGQADPLGGTDAWIVTDASATTIPYLFVNNAPTTNGGPYTLSLFIKKDASPTVYPGILFGNAGAFRGIVCDPSDGSTTEMSFASGSTAAVEDYDATYYRFSVSGTTDGVDSDVWLYPAYNSDGSASSSAAAQGANTFFGAQFEECGVARTYNKTEIFTPVADYISTGSATYEPTVTAGAVTATADFISSGSTTYEPTATVGAVSVTADFIASGSATYEPTASPGAVTVTPDYISTGSATYEPTVQAFLEGRINADFIPSGSATYEPTASPGSVTKIADYIASGSSTYEPTATSVSTVVPDYIASGSATYEPAVTSPSVTATVTYIASGSRVYEPSITGGIPVVVAPSGGGWLYNKKNTKKRYDAFMRNREADARADEEFMRMLLGEQLQPGEKVVVDNLHKKVRVRLEVDTDIEELAPQIQAAVPFPVIIERMKRRKKPRRIITKEVIMQDDAEIMKRLFNS